MEFSLQSRNYILWLFLLWCHLTFLVLSASCDRGQSFEASIRRHLRGQLSAMQRIRQHHTQKIVRCRRHCWCCWLHHACRHSLGRKSIQRPRLVVSGRGPGVPVDQVVHLRCGWLQPWHQDARPKRQLSDVLVSKWTRYWLSVALSTCFVVWDACSLVVYNCVKFAFAKCMQTIPIIFTHVLYI